MMNLFCYFWILSISLSLYSTNAQGQDSTYASTQFVTVLGIAQDAGYPQAGCVAEHCMRYWRGEEKRRHVVSLGLTDTESGQNWLFEATPDFSQQLNQLHSISGTSDLSGIFLTHAHIGHYTGLMYLGREAMGASNIPVYVMPKMKLFLETNAPWSQLVKLGNIELVEIEHDVPIQLRYNLTVTPILVPHRDEFSETVGFRIETDEKSLLFIPDINKWHIWDKDIIEEVKKVNHALLDATFYNQSELPNRDMSEIPHPFVEESLNLFEYLPETEKRKIMFIHFNHTNPLIFDGPERRKVERLGYRVASEGDIIYLSECSSQGC